MRRWLWDGRVIEFTRLMFAIVVVATIDTWANRVVMICAVEAYRHTCPHTRRDVPTP